MRFKNKIAALIFCFLVFPIISKASFNTGEMGPFAVLQIKGKDVSGFIGKSISDFRMIRWSQNGFEAIPFQVDLKSEKDAYILPGDPDDSRNVLNPNDEIAVMGFDLGAIANESAMEIFEGLVYRLEMTGPFNQKMFAYFTSDSRWPISPRHYVAYDHKSRIASGVNYRIGVTNGNEGLTELVEVNGINIIDRLKLRARASILFEKLQFVRTENDVIANLKTRKVGPVRILRRIDFRVRVALGLTSPTIERLSITYPFHMLFPNDLKVPFRPDSLFSSIKVEALYDFNPKVRGAKLDCPYCGNGFIVDGKPDDASSLKGKYPKWFTLHGDFGTLFASVKVDDPTALKLPVVKFAVYEDDINDPDPPEGYPGKFGMFGYRLEKMEKIPRGIYSFLVIMGFPPEYPPEGGAHLYKDLYGPFIVNVCQVK